jgi:hypothetical protein
MLSIEEILRTLDQASDGVYNQFPYLGDTLSYLADSRLNVFQNNEDQWAIVAERLGFSFRQDVIILEIYYFGNCLFNLESNNGQFLNKYTVYPVDTNAYCGPDDLNHLEPGENYWSVRNQKIEISNNTNDYKKAGISLEQIEPGVIAVEEALRLLVVNHSDLLRATDEELYKSIPKQLNKILVLDEWYHKDYIQLAIPGLNEQQIQDAYNNLGEAAAKEVGNMNNLKKLINRTLGLYNSENTNQQLNNTPSSYETWQLLAEVIASGDISKYKPRKKPNSHWTYYPESGTY